MNKQPQITVVDAIMGTGKTEWAIRLMNQGSYAYYFEEGSQFLYITPFIDEAKRIRQSCTGLDFKLPEVIRGRKLNDLNEMLQDGENIASTHALFSYLNEESREALRRSPTVLIIDEEIEFVRPFKGITAHSHKQLMQDEMIVVDDEGRVRWNYAKWVDYPDDGDRYSDIKRLADNGNLVLLDGKFWVWEFPLEILGLFDHVYILTYLFEGSMLSTYLKMHGVQYSTKTLSPDLELVDFDNLYERRELVRIQHLVELVDDPKLNAIGTPLKRDNPLSASWFDRMARKHPEVLAKLKAQLQTYFRHHTEGGAKLAMWSTFKRVKSKLTGNGYGGGFVAANAKATNEHRHRKNLAYCVNVFSHQGVQKYFAAHGQQVNEDLYAVSQLVQWVWRSRIRLTKDNDGNPLPDDARRVKLYLPSERMRELFQGWLQGRYTLRRVRCPEWQLQAPSAAVLEFPQDALERQAEDAE